MLGPALQDGVQGEAGADAGTKILQKSRAPRALSVRKKKEC